MDERQSTAEALGPERLFDPQPHLHWLGNGRLATVISNAGGGGVSLGETALTRWSDDRIEDGDGYVLYLRDLDGGGFWSLGYQPARVVGTSYRVWFTQAQAIIERIDAGIATRLEVGIAAEDDADLRRVTLRNLGDRPRRIEVTSYAEIVLAPAAADRAHPGFAKLFVQTAAMPGGVLAWRRPRAAGEAITALAHWLVASDADAIERETDRARFIGRGRGLDRPVALLGEEPLSGTVGNVLDPIASLRCRLDLASGETRSVAFGLAAAGSVPAARAIAERYARPLDVDTVLGAERAVAAACGAAADALVDEAAPQPRPAVAARTHGSTDGEPLLCDNGYGGFSVDGREYVIRVRPDLLPPLPWTHVVANPAFGFLISERGAGCTWGGNSRLNRITPWFNDPIADPHGEALYLRDIEDGSVWSPLPGPAGDDAAYEIRYGFGYARCRHRSRDVEQDVSLFVPRNDPVKITRLRLRNLGDRPQRLSVYAYARLVLGGDAPPAERVVETWFDAPTQTLQARNPQHPEFPGHVAFAAASVGGATATLHYTTDRAAFLGRNGVTARPAAVVSGGGLGGETATGADRCFALQVEIVLAAGAVAECCLLLGQAESGEAAGALALRYRDPVTVDVALGEVRRFWEDLLGGIHVDTGVPAIDLPANGWLAYQTLACRIWGRTAFYQSGGAFGFRDQLQDAAALAHLAPQITREQILLHAAHQFVEGDVLHWWHPPHSRGMRTRMSDDLLWLPFLTAFYVEASGDAAIWDEPVRFIAARALAPGEDEAYLLPENSGEAGSVYEHCCRAIDRSLARGAHGLPLMGTGDWNDGMNRVGREGRGESVWLGFFLYDILGRFVGLSEDREDRRRAAHYARFRAELRQALDTAGWDGAWYRRAYYDDGTPLGSADNEECRIDALAQAWAILSGAAPEQRREQALDALESHLISERDGIIRLLAPPFDRTAHDPGYIKGYVPGVRENGGQYTHAALWVVMAMAEAGRAPRAARLLEMLSPVSRAATRARADVYKAEPYVVAADIYGAPPHVGRGGWTWYTGSSGWMLRVIVEALAGVRLQGGNELVVRPQRPLPWPGYTLRYRPPGRDTRLRIAVRRAPGAASGIEATLDDRPHSAEDGCVRLALVDDGHEHELVVSVGDQPA